MKKEENEFLILRTRYEIIIVGYPVIPLLQHCDDDNDAIFPLFLSLFMINPLDQPRSSFVSARNRRFLVTEPYFLSRRFVVTPVLVVCFASCVFASIQMAIAGAQRHFIATDHEVRVLDALTQPRVKRLPSVTGPNNRIFRVFFLHNFFCFLHCFLGQDIFVYGNQIFSITKIKLRSWFFHNCE